MRHYELMLILDSDLDERTVAPSLDTYLNLVRADGGRSSKVDVWGRRKLAYEINKKSDGIYAVVDISCTSEAVAELDRQLGLNENGAADQGPAPGRRTAAMAGETNITIIGNLVDDPELRFTPSGAAVASFRRRVDAAHLRSSDQRVEGRRHAVPHLQRLAAGC